mmetsp:Transcript_34740/g.116093  ORF Transcript_34740/g.116093 Transcript_34740/m.116093 type:complete len:265 (+) Transcript_34740:254-1048(+)
MRRDRGAAARRDGGAAAGGAAAAPPLAARLPVRRPPPLLDEPWASRRHVARRRSRGRRWVGVATPAAHSAADRPGGAGAGYPRRGRRRHIHRCSCLGRRRPCCECRVAGCEGDGADGPPAARLGPFARGALCCHRTASLRTARRGRCRAGLGRRQCRRGTGASAARVGLWRRRRLRRPITGGGVASWRARQRRRKGGPPLRRGGGGGRAAGRRTERLLARAAALPAATPQLPRLRDWAHAHRVREAAGARGARALRRALAGRHR